MNRSLRKWAWTAFLALSLIACSGEATSLSEQQVVGIVWDALEPNTSSHDLSNWEVVEALLVTGREVVQHFEGDPAPGCWKDPTPPANDRIISSRTYWFVHLRARSATPLPQKGMVSPTAPPLTPEPFLRQAFFLLDAEDGQIVARHLHCVIY
jgi:hypothetical protein